MSCAPGRAGVAGHSELPRHALRLAVREERGPMPSEHCVATLAEAPANVGLPEAQHLARRDRGVGLPRGPAAGGAPVRRRRGVARRAPDPAGHALQCLNQAWVVHDHAALHVHERVAAVPRHHLHGHAREALVILARPDEAGEVRIALLALPRLHAPRDGFDLIEGPPLGPGRREAVLLEQVRAVEEHAIVAVPRYGQLLIPVEVRAHLAALQLLPPFLQ
mmetsp:Transcript_116737/g.337191  ORF Transcript_116737/g.337191 Transcript_116737/m.337191 type:complete len:220 (+) Transcript_116737:3090-3749(+)